MTQKKTCSWLSRLFNNSFNFPSLEKDFRAQQYDYNIRAKANYMAHFFLHDTVSSEVAGRAKYTLSDSLLCLLFWNSSLALRKTKSAVASKLVCWNGLFVFCNQHDCMKTLIVLILKCMYEENRNRRRQYEKKKDSTSPQLQLGKTKNVSDVNIASLLWWPRKACAHSKAQTHPVIIGSNGYYDYEVTLYLHTHLYNRKINTHIALKIYTKSIYYDA